MRRDWKNISMMGLPSRVVYDRPMNTTFWNQFIKLMKKDLCTFRFHAGSVSYIGNPRSIRKKHRPENLKKGEYRIRKCERCHALFTTDDDWINKDQTERIAKDKH